MGPRVRNVFHGYVDAGRCSRSCKFSCGRFHGINTLETPAPKVMAMEVTMIAIRMERPLILFGNSQSRRKRIDYAIQISASLQLDPENLRMGCAADGWTHIPDEE